MGSKKKMLALAVIILFLVVVVYLILDRTVLDMEKPPVDDNGNPYKTFEVGETTWLAENLRNSTHEKGESWCYEGNTENCEKLGRLYNLDAALTVCPEGWSLPSDEDWNKLEEFGILGDSPFGVVKGGHLFDEYFYELGEAGYWWSSTVEDHGSGWMRVFRDDEFARSSFSPDHGFSVRCVKTKVTN